MSEISYSRLLQRGWKKIALFAVLAAIFATVVSFAFPLRYSSSMRLLILQKQ